MESTLHPLSLRRTTAVAIGGIAVVLIAGILLHASAVDLPVTRAFNTLHTGAVATITDGIYWGIDSFRGVFVALVPLLLLGWMRRSLVVPVVAAGTLALSWAPIPLLKIVFARPRPDMALLEHPRGLLPHDWSFPSGHTAFISVLAVVLVLATTGTRAQNPMRVIAVLGVAGVFFVVLTVGVHFPSDALASIVWALTVTPLVWALLTRAANRWRPGSRTEAPGR